MKIARYKSSSKTNKVLGPCRFYFIASPGIFLFIVINKMTSLWKTGTQCPRRRHLYVLLSFPFSVVCFVHRGVNTNYFSLEIDRVKGNSGVVVFPES